MAWLTLLIPAAATIIVAIITRRNREENRADISALTKVIDQERGERLDCQRELEKVNKRLAKVETRVGLKRPTNPPYSG